MGNDKKTTILHKHSYFFVHECHEDESTGEIWYEQKFYLDNNLEYSARMTEEQYIYSLNYPNLFRMAEMFSMGSIPVNCQEVRDDKCIWNIQEANKKPRGFKQRNLLVGKNNDLQK